MEQTKFEPYSNTRGKAPTRNPNFFYGTYLRSDLDDLFEAGVPRGPGILVSAILLNFLRHQFVTNKRRKWHAPQKWYLHNQFSENVFSRQYIGECLDWLVKVGAISKEKEPGYTNQICYGFIGILSEEHPKGEDLLRAKRKLKNETESQFSNSKPSNETESPSLNNILLDSNKPHPDAALLHPDATEPHRSYIYKNKTSSSHKLTEGEICVTFEKRKDGKDGIFQDPKNIDNDSEYQYSASIENENAEFPRKHKAIGSGKNSGGRPSQGSSEMVNSIAPVYRDQSDRQSRFIKKGGSMLSKDELTPEYRYRFEDFEFMSYVARKWSHTGERPGQSYIGSLNTIWEKIGVVEGSFLKNPPKIDVEWKAYIRGPVTRSLEDLVESLEDGMDRQHLDKNQVERYLPSISIEMQSENPVATGPILQLMGQLAGQQQQQHLPTSAIAMEAKLLDGQVGSEPKPEVAELNENISQSAISSPVDGDVVEKEEQKPEPDSDAIAHNFELVERAEIFQSEEEMGSSCTISEAIAQQVEQSPGPVTIEAWGDLDARSLTDCVIVQRAEPEISEVIEPDHSSMTKDGDIVIKEEQNPVDHAEGAPPIAILREIYKKSIGRLLVTRQIASNPQWGYEIIDGDVVEKEEQKPEPDWDAIAQQVEHEYAQLSRESGLVTTEAWGELDERSLTDCAIAHQAELVPQDLGPPQAGEETSPATGLALFKKTIAGVKAKAVQAGNVKKSSSQSDGKHERMVQLDRELQSRRMARLNQVLNRTAPAPGDEYDF